MADTVINGLGYLAIEVDDLDDAYRPYQHEPLVARRRRQMCRKTEPGRHLAKTDAICGGSRAERFFHLDGDRREDQQLTLASDEAQPKRIGSRQTAPQG